MTKRILLASLIGGAVVFLVSGFLHMATSLGEYGIRALPNEQATLSLMRASIPESGLYLFPAADMSQGRSGATQAAYLEKYRTGPVGIMAYSNPGGDLRFGRLLFNQFLFSVVAALFLAWILSATVESTSYASRVSIVVLASLFAACVYSLPSWNWYRFPINYTIANIFTWTVSWLIAGLVMAAVVKPSRAAGT